MAAGLLLLGCATQQELAERRELTRRAVEQAVADRQLRIDVTSMSTMRYGTRMVTSDFFLRLHGDTLQSYLPYLGQAYQAPMASPARGLNFEERIARLTESRPKADQVRLDIDVKTDEDTYHYIVDIFNTGKADIRVQSQHRDAISFNGDCQLP